MAAPTPRTMVPVSAFAAGRPRLRCEPHTQRHTDRIDPYRAF
ncbi:hypothetical protein I545_4318 [Mycobacterium kansasii 662]|uniref:Uncharacterized protein n=2 Tax=Mycobacterium kansasii TaxID=1768 RepID=A0A1V3XCY3_MYCKA|nr:hypothetical protein I547_6917 [Mycobacterium kansasii 824]EUA16586.1 hypothetical protein I545_4318 [Mycobacterium kansasii 662]KEP40910.1 hypothetical protein MKSMC1_40360 [Mycobacterium kansasii]OOK72856.1 hypothetical protein BZL29_4919 [Mycobacterium kansasii]OOK76311.1 hypothetical protein BZL30_3221 [Mycobacterium kansasii]